MSFKRILHNSDIRIPVENNNSIAAIFLTANFFLYSVFAVFKSLDKY